MKKPITMLVCVSMLAAPVTVMAADVDQGTYSFTLPEGWEGEAPNFHKSNNPVSTLSISEIDGSVSDIITMGDEYVSTYITDVTDMETIISLHETSYSDIPAATVSVFGTKDGNPVVVQNDLFDAPDGGVISFAYYYNDDNRDYIDILDSLKLGSAAEDSSEPASEPTMGEKNALSSANNYLKILSFSYSGLIEQLTSYDGYSEEEATYAADNCGADWNEQAALAAENYLKLMSFSRQGLIEQLVDYDGFTQEQAEYGVTQNGY